MRDDETWTSETQRPLAPRGTWARSAQPFGSAAALAVAVIGIADALFRWPTRPGFGAAPALIAALTCQAGILVLRNAIAIRRRGLLPRAGGDAEEECARSSSAQERLIVDRVKLENQLLQELNRARNVDGAVNAVVRRLALHGQNGFVAHLKPAGDDGVVVVNSRGLTRESCERFELDPDLRRRLETAGSTELSGRDLRASRLYQNLSPADRRRITRSLFLTRVGDERRRLGWIVTTSLFRTGETLSEQFNLIEEMLALIVARLPDDSLTNESPEKAPLESEKDASNKPARETILDVLESMIARTSALRGALVLRRPDGGLAADSGLRAGVSGPPGVEDVWRRHEVRIAAETLSVADVTTLGREALERIGIRTLMASAISVPVTLRGQIIGSLCAAFRSDAAPTADALATVENAAREISASIARTLSTPNTMPQPGTALVHSVNPARTAIPSGPKSLPRSSGMEAFFKTRSGPLSNAPALQANIQDQAPCGAEAGIPLNDGPSVDDTENDDTQRLASVTHELRTPMVGILGMTELMLESDLTDEQRQYLSAVRSSSQNLLQLVNDLLDHSKLDAGKVEFEHIDFSLRDTLQETLLPLSLRAKEKGLAFECRIEEITPDLWRGDPLRFRQVVTNLVANALKFTEKGGVSLTARNEGTGGLFVAVRDTGIGVPRDKQARLFAAYAQADSSTARKFGGTGLGLSISKRLVEGMRGTIGFQSEPGEGSEFHFAVPFQSIDLEGPTPTDDRPDDISGSSPAVGPAAGVSLPQDVRNVSNCDKPPRVRRRVLLADDHEINRAVGQARLEAAGHEVTTAGDGAEAVSLFTAGSFDLALLDLQMPRCDGFQAARLIREIDDRRSGRARLVALTALATERERSRCHEAGFDACLEKPLTSEKIATLFASSIGAAPLHLTGANAPAMKLSPLAQQLLPTFLRTSREHLESLRAAFSRGNLSQVADSCHSINGAASTLELTDVSEAAQRLEQQARHGDWSELPARIAELERQIRDLTEETEAADSRPADVARGAAPREEASFLQEFMLKT